jgi:hypothetical protein
VETQALAHLFRENEMDAARLRAASQKKPSGASTGGQNKGRTFVGVN